MYSTLTCGPHLLAPGSMVSTEPLFPADSICPAVGQGRLLSFLFPDEKTEA